MNTHKYAALLLLFTFPYFSQSQLTYPKVEVIHTNVNTSIRGLCVVNDNIIWVSGSNGMVGKSQNGGKNWKWLTVKGFEKADFRDIEAFDASTAIIMGIAEPAYILKTTDGGDSWKVVYENKTKGMFLDAMDFRDNRNGVVIGDPADGHFFMAKTSDGGSSWHEIDKELRPKADSGEAFFAASGTNIRVMYNSELLYVSGGQTSSLYKKDEKIILPIIQGKATTGANSIAVYENYKKSAGKKIIVAGGDFDSSSSISKNLYYSDNGGQTWNYPKTPPHGYRSCVEFLTKNELVSCGLNGVDYSTDGGKNWKLISDEGFHTCMFAKFGNTIFLAGSNGKIGRLVYPSRKK